jgi:protein O-GlcNAc transferase
VAELQAALIAFSTGEQQKAQNICLEILEEFPNCASAWHLIGVVAQQQGKHHVAAESLEKTILLDPLDTDAYYNLAATYLAIEKIEAALQAYQKAIELRPDFTAAHYNLGNLYAQRQQLSKAECCYRKAVDLQPELAQVHANLGFTLLYQGKISPAIDSFQKALERNPNSTVAQDNLLLAMHYATCLDPLEVFLNHKKWGSHLSQMAVPWPLSIAVPKQKLRIGYLSPDFCTHSVSYFFEPLLAHHDTETYEIYCYACIGDGDETTTHLRSLASHWRECAHLSDLEIAEQIHVDRIDILVDLAGHTTNNRLRVLAYKPASIQITYLGYPGTTGLPTVDYRITDLWADPLSNDAYYTEKLLRLEAGFLCYAPPLSAPSVSSLPAARNGYITFGSFNNLPKMNPSVVALWAEILLAVPNSRLLLKSPPFADAQIKQDYQDLFAFFNIPAERLIFRGRLPNREDHLACYGQIDIALDPFPYNGTTTTCESLWMGVPVITLAGVTHASRVGLSLLSCLGLENLVAKTPEQYLQIAIELATDKQKLEDFRTSIRFWMASSSLCDGETFARQVEALYLKIWQEKCHDSEKAM